LLVKHILELTSSDYIFNTVINAASHYITSSLGNGLTTPIIINPYNYNPCNAQHFVIGSENRY
jgi:hypothetical protein